MSLNAIKHSNIYYLTSKISLSVEATAAILLTALTEHLVEGTTSPAKTTSFTPTSPTPPALSSTVSTIVVSRASVASITSYIIPCLTNKNKDFFCLPFIVSLH